MFISLLRMDVGFLFLLSGMSLGRLIIRDFQANAYLYVSWKGNLFNVEKLRKIGFTVYSIGQPLDP